MSLWIKYVGCALVLLGFTQAGNLSSAAAQQAAARKKVTSDADLPRFSYPIAIAPSALLQSDDATFNPFMQKVNTDVESVLAGYEIEDKATLRTLLRGRYDVQLLQGDRTGALDTVNRIHDLEEKPLTRATGEAFDRALLQAWTKAGTSSGPAFEGEFEKDFAASVNALPWDLVQDWAKSLKASSDFVTLKVVLNSVKANVDEDALKSKSVDLHTALQLLSSRVYVKFRLPVNAEVGMALTPYIRTHNAPKPDIWAAREVTLTESDKLTPARIGIWDSGVDTALYPGQLFVDPAPGAHGPHGLAFDTAGNLYAGDLQPMTEEQQAAYPKALRLDQGAFDFNNLIDTPAAAEYRDYLSNTPSDQLERERKTLTFIGQWMHGTHVAGIAVRGNPAARLVVAQFNDGLADLPFAPTVEWANKFKADFIQIRDYFRENNVRVVNMSWDDDVSEIEEWLMKTSQEKDPAARKQFAQQIYAIWREGVEDAIRNAPKTLFVCAAGNANSSAGFLGDVPASLHLPNLIAVGAVDQAGEETSFTSYGDTVVLYADGFQVESYVPGGTKLKFSGTSMATPNVVNLAAKLIALDPSLTPQQTIALMEKGASISQDGRLRLINPKATVALLKQQPQ
jgi:subtilisin family serine protease